MDHLSSQGSHTKEQGLSVAPSLDLLTASNKRTDAVGADTVRLSIFSIILASAATFIAGALVSLINLFTHLAFYQEWRWDDVTPFQHSLGAWVILLPVAGGIIIGYMARYGSSAIRGHGIPEAMERILEHQSVIPLRMTFLKPLSAAVSIGTGGPFGAEGPIISTGGALGSFIGQIFPFHVDERKTLLAAGAAAGMTAIFGSPVAAVLLAIELLLFEYRPRSFIPVALAAATAAGIRIAFGFTNPAFPMPLIEAPSASAIAASIGLGIIMGWASVAVTKAVYVLEDLFEKLPIHWMWWPAVGGLAVGIIGWIQPRTLGVGYSNITDLLGAQQTLGFVLVLVIAKFASWAIALGSGTSGGTLAPLFTIGAGLGFLVAKIVSLYFPSLHLDPGLAALVGMAAIFAGASRALLTSIIFAFETTRQPLGLLPLLGGCTASYLVSSLFMRHSIMTERMERRGVEVPNEYGANPLKLTRISKILSKDFIVLAAEQSLEECRTWLQAQAQEQRQSHFLLIDAKKQLLAVVHEQDILRSEQPAHLPIRDLTPFKAQTINERTSLPRALELLENNPNPYLVVIDAASQPIGVIGFKDVALAQRHPKLQRTRTYRIPKRLLNSYRSRRKS